jgi:hypothetical protein
MSMSSANYEIHIKNVDVACPTLNFLQLRNTNKEHQVKLSEALMVGYYDMTHKLT